jgi:hypothetical protein
MVKSFKGTQTKKLIIHKEIKMIKKLNGRVSTVLEVTNTIEFCDIEY